MATEARETTGLIGSDKVEGTAVYDATGNKMGSIARVMIGKRVYAVLQFGGFLGLGSDSYPLPWDALTYDTTLGGYVSPSLRSSLKGHRNTRASSGTGRIARGATKSPSITGRRGETTERARGPSPRWANFPLGASMAAIGIHEGTAAADTS
jgi:hypothetical protein